eukprot:gene27904-34477_t
MEEDSEVTALKKQVDELTKERDALEKDVETLCMQNVGGGGAEKRAQQMLLDRIAKLERDLQKRGDELRLALEGKDQIAEKLAQQKSSQRQVEQVLKDEMAKSVAKDADIQFYMNKAASVLGDTNEMKEELEVLREASAQMEREKKEKAWAHEGALRQAREEALLLQ